MPINLPAGIAVSADFSSTTHATLTMSASDLEDFVRIARAIIEKPLHAQKMFNMSDSVFSTLVDMSNIVLPSDLL